MSIATVRTGALDKAPAILGTAMMLAWTLGLGILGFVLLLAIAYAMVLQNPTLVIVCSFLLFAPLLMIIVWGLLSAAELAREKWAMHYGVSGPSWWERRQAHRKPYRAYFL